MTDIQNRITALINTLIESRKSLIIASLNKDNLPEASATPFLKIDTKFYVFISELASHTQNLMHASQCSILLIEDEQTAKNTFARQRLSYECTSLIIERTDPLCHKVLDQFEQRQGKTMSLLRQLSDFHLFELNPRVGNYIEGFGKAYRLTGECLDKIELQTKT